MHTKINVTTCGLLKLIKFIFVSTFAEYLFLNVIFTCVFKEVFIIIISLLFRIRGFFGTQFVPVTNKIDGS